MSSTADAASPHVDGGARAVAARARPAKRRRKYEALFRFGHFTTGVVRAVQKGSGGVFATYKYEFAVGDSTYVACMEQAQKMSYYWGEGDVVPVLYDPADPSRCCFVYR